WPRHALAQSCSSFRRQFPPHWGHDARSQSSLPSAFTPTSAPLTPFPRHPRIPRHSRPPEISIYVLPPTKRRARVGQPSFCAGFAAQKLLIRCCVVLTQWRFLTQSYLRASTISAALGGVRLRGAQAPRSSP